MPDTPRIAASARALSPATVKTFDQELTILVDCGFTPVLALRTIAALTRYVKGSSARSRPGLTGTPRRHRASSQRSPSF